jgi:RNA polymerase sigma factor (sigma-70 family)
MKARLERDPCSHPPNGGARSGSPMRSDKDLLAAWSEGDTSAGQLLCERYFPIVYRFFSKRIKHDIDDLVQRTFFACTRHREQVRDGSSFRAFVLVVARNELHAHLRASYRRGQSVELSTTSIADLSETVNQLIIRREEQRLLLRALRRIPLDLQEVLKLSYFKRLKGHELAATLDVPEGTMRSRLRRAIAAMRVELQCA